MSKECEFCQDKYRHTVIQEYDNWTIQLFLNQYYLGRCLILLDRHAVDITELKPREREELFEKALPNLKKSIDKEFQPDLYNYATLGNDCRHFHLHVIPRYSNEREFKGTTFEDQNWNSHYTPHPKDFEISENLFKEIKQKLASNLKN